MDRARDHLLPGAGFARDAGWSLSLAQRSRWSGTTTRMRELRPTHGAEPEPLIELLAQIRVLVLQASLLERRAQHVQQFVELKGLGDEVGGAALDGLDRVLHRAVTRDDDRDDAGIALEGGFDDPLAVDARQTQIGDDDVEREVAQQLDCAFAGFGFGDLESLLHGDVPRSRFEAPVRRLRGGDVFGGQPSRRVPEFWRSRFRWSSAKH